MNQIITITVPPGATARVIRNRNVARASYTMSQAAYDARVKNLRKARAAQRKISTAHENCVTDKREAEKVKREAEKVKREAEKVKREAKTLAKAKRKYERPSFDHMMTFKEAALHGAAFADMLNEIKYAKDIFYSLAQNSRQMTNEAELHENRFKIEWERINNLAGDMAQFSQMFSQAAARMDKIYSFAFEKNNANE